MEPIGYRGTTSSFRLDNGQKKCHFHSRDPRLLSPQVLPKTDLDGVDGWSRPQVVHSGLQSLLPGVEMHGRQLAEIRLGNVNVEGHRLIDVSATIRRHVDHFLLAGGENTLRRKC